MQSKAITNKVENVINGNFHSGGGAYLFPFIMKIDPIRLELLGKVLKNCHYFNSFLGLGGSRYKMENSPFMYSLMFSFFPADEINPKL